MKSKSLLAPPVHRLNDGRPIIQAVVSHPWESKVTFNPACVLVTDKSELSSLIPKLPFSNEIKRTLSAHSSLCFLLYRAQGKKTPTYDYTCSSIGLAVLSADLRVLARHVDPVILPDQEYDHLGVEDPRITKVDGRYVMMYCGYSSGQPKNRIRVAIASSTDFVHWEKHGLLNGEFNRVDNKNAMLFPERIGGKYLLLHRPMEGEDAMAIHWAESDTVLGQWQSRGVLLKSRPDPEFTDTWIGGGAPPLKLSDNGYLFLYHIGNRRADGTRRYDLGIAVGDLTRSDIIVRRDEPFLSPELRAETTGDADLGVNNVVFICGAFFYQGDLLFPYAGADSVILGAKVSKAEIRDYVGQSNQRNAL